MDQKPHRFSRRQYLALAACLACMAGYYGVMAYANDAIYNGTITRQHGIAFMLCFTAVCFFTSLFFTFKPYAK